MKIVVKKGLDVPIQGKPASILQDLDAPSKIALNLHPFKMIRFKVHVKVGEWVKIGQPLVENKSHLGQMFASPASGVVSEIRRGEKRRLLNIVIDVSSKETYEEFGTYMHASREDILDLFMRAGIFPHIRMRPFDLIANPKYVPRSIFVRAIETLPFAPSFEMQVKGYEQYFQVGLDTLVKLTTGTVHLVYQEGSTCKAFTEANGIEKHMVRGPHPAGTSSLHIHEIEPIKNCMDYVWTLDATNVLTIGKMVLEGRYFTDRLLSLGGEGIVEGKRGFIHARQGFSINELIMHRLTNQALRFISGDPLTGTQVSREDFICFHHNALSIIPENTKRQFFHFLRPGFRKYTATKTYFSGHMQPPQKGFSFTTNQHGEVRAFIDGAIYERVMPMHIPTMHLIKAIICGDFELAEKLGLLEVTGDDFALASFICPSKIEMIQLVSEGLHNYAKEMGH